jgi:hypothetical protein
MEDSQRVVIFSMDRAGNRSVYCPDPKSVDDAWPRYSVVKPYLDVWFDLHIGKIVSSPFCEFQPGAANYPRGVASVLTHDSVLSLWAYVTKPNIFVTATQVSKAIGSRLDMVRQELEEAGVENGSGRSIRMSDVRRVFGREATDRLVLYSGQIADFLGVHITSVPGIVDRLGIGVPGRNQVGVRWGQLRRVQRIGPRSYEVRDA